MAFTVLVYHDMPAFAAEKLARSGIAVKRGLEPTEAGICRDIAGCSALIAFEQPERGFNRTIIDAAPELRLIARRGVGYETVDVDYAAEQGIYVTNTPAVNSRTVAEAAIMLMLECARNAQQVSARFRQDRRDYRMFTSDVSTRGFELTGKTLGLVGCGSIGRHVAQIASQGFGMRVLGYDAYAPRLPDCIERAESMDRLLRDADIVSLHVPSTPETRRSIGRRQFEMMKDSAILINTSRGDVVCEEELIDALNRGVIRGAGLDVFSSEPISEAAYPLFDMERVCLTPHNASFTVESLYNAYVSVVNSILETAAGRRPAAAVNNPAHPRCRPGRGASGASDTTDSRPSAAAEGSEA